MGPSVLFGPLLATESVRKEKNCVTLLKNFSFSSHPSSRLAGLLKYDSSGAVSGQGTASRDQQQGISIMPEELLHSSLFASFRKYILLMAGFPMATVKSVQEKTL